MNSETQASEPASSPVFRWDAADAYLFDIDGTLLNSRDAVHYNAFHNAVRRFFGVSSKIDGVPVHGNTDPGIIRAVLRREGISDCDIDARLPLLLAQMCDEVETNAGGLRPELCPSAEALVLKLHGAGKLLGVASGNLERIAWKKLEPAGLRPYFAFGSFSDRRELRADIVREGIAEARRRLHSGSRVYVVGDTPFDIQAARLAGAPVIAIATGIFSREELSSHAPDLCVSSCADLLGT